MENTPPKPVRIQLPDQSQQLLFIALPGGWWASGRGAPCYLLTKMPLHKHERKCARAFLSTISVRAGDRETITMETNVTSPRLRTPHPPTTLCRRRHPPPPQYELAPSSSSVMPAFLIPPSIHPPLRLSIYPSSVNGLSNQRAGSGDNCTASCHSRATDGPPFAFCQSVKVIAVKRDLSSHIGGPQTGVHEL